MDYSALIQFRKSVRAFQDKAVPDAVKQELAAYFREGCKRLLPELKTELRFFEKDTQSVLEGAAGYQEFLIGAPCYLVILSEAAEHAGENAGYMGEDLVLKLSDMGLDSCWLTFTDEAKVREALGLDTPLQVAGVLAFGYGKKMPKKIRLNILSMSNVNAAAVRQYYAPKVSLYDMVFADRWGCGDGVDSLIGDMDSMLWRAFYAASLAPSYMNRQPYGFILHGSDVVLVRKPDAYTDDIDARLNLGVVLLHFSAVASQLLGKLKWEMGGSDEGLELPAGYSVSARCRIG
jgi:hypothetical protein